MHFEVLCSNHVNRFSCASQCFSTCNQVYESTIIISSNAHVCRSTCCVQQNTNATSVLQREDRVLLNEEFQTLNKDLVCPTPAPSCKLGSRQSVLLQLFLHNNPEKSDQGERIAQYVMTKVQLPIASSVTETIKVASQQRPIYIQRRIYTNETKWGCAICSTPSWPCT